MPKDDFRINPVSLLKSKNFLLAPHSSSAMHRSNKHLNCARTANVGSGGIPRTGRTLARKTSAIASRNSETLPVGACARLLAMMPLTVSSMTQKPLPWPVEATWAMQGRRRTGLPISFARASSQRSFADARSAVAAGRSKGNASSTSFNNGMFKFFLMLARRTSPVLRSAARSGHEIGKR